MRTDTGARTALIAGAAVVAACGALGAGAEEARAAGFQNSAQSATATAMGAMGTANPDEPNASFYNPSAMPMRRGFNIYLGDTILIPSSEYVSPDGEITAETQAQIFPPPNLHVAYSAGDWAVGLGATFPYGAGIAWDDDWVGRETIRNQTLQAFNVNPNVAYRFDSIGLSLAGGVQIVRGSVDLANTVILRQGEDPREVQARLGGTGWGFGGTAALTYQPAEELTLALNYRSRVTIDFEGNARFEGEEGTPFERTFVDQPIETAITLPDTLTLGIGWDLDRFFLGLDLTFTAWNTYDRIDVAFQQPCPEGAQTCEPGETTPPDIALEPQWEDAIALRVGAQYEVIDDLKLRVGGAFDMTPIPDETLAPSLPGNNRAAASLGAGYEFSNFRIDAAYQYVAVLERTVDNDILAGTYNTNAHIFGLNVGYGFGEEPVRGPRPSEPIEEIEEVEEPVLAPTEAIEPATTP